MSRQLRRHRQHLTVPQSGPSPLFPPRILRPGPTPAGPVAPPRQIPPDVGDLIAKFKQLHFRAHPHRPKPTLAPPTQAALSPPTQAVLSSPTISGPTISGHTISGPSVSSGANKIQSDEKKAAGGERKQVQPLNGSDTVVTRSDGGRGSLTAAGEVIGGFEDFVAGTLVLSLPRIGALGEVQPPHILLKNWRVLWEMVPLWRFYASKYPNLSSVFGLETGAGGDCLFHAVSAGYNHVFQSLIFHMEMVRDVAAQQLANLTEAEVIEFIIDWKGMFTDKYKQMSHSDRVARLQKAIRKSGNDYWGETGTLRQLLLRSPPFASHKIGFAVLNIRNKPVQFRPITDIEKSAWEKVNPKRKAPKEVPTKWEPRVETTIVRLPDTKFLMFLHCLENSHWILVGYAPNVDSSPAEAPIGSTFPINAYPLPLFPFIREDNN